MWPEKYRTGTRGLGSQRVLSLLLQVERTEVLRSCSSPVFSRVLALEYFFEEKQPLQFHVFDAEDGATSPSSDTFLGSTECTLGQVCTPVQSLLHPSASASGSHTKRKEF